MKIKVCGLTQEENIRNLPLDSIDLLGFIFYEKSPRNLVVNGDNASAIRRINKDKVGVFVNESFDTILQIAAYFDLNYIQLHGNESPELVSRLAPYFHVIKAFSVDDQFDFSTCEAYAEADFFLFDTKGASAGGNGKKFEWDLLENYKGNRPFLLSGGIGPDDYSEILDLNHPKLIGVDINSGFEITPGIKDEKEVTSFVEKIKGTGFSGLSDDGYYGEFGGAFIPEILHETVEELRNVYEEIKSDEGFKQEFKALLSDYVGRPTPLYEAKRLSEKYGAKIYLKREDLNHTGAHKINNTIGQILLAQRMGKTRIIAETGAGQHGVATATVCALMGLECVVYMGEKDIARQAPNVGRMKMLGATVVPATSGSKTLKDATNEAIRDWINNPDSFYIIGSVVGPHPYPEMVAWFQSVISEEITKQLKEKEGVATPDMVVACVGGGSNAAGAFYHFLDTPKVNLVAVEAAGHGVYSGKTAATSVLGTSGIIHGSKTLMMQTPDGQITEPHSISAGLDYPGIGPLHAHLIKTNRVKAIAVTDDEALIAAYEITALEGIIPALESAHALAGLEKLDIAGKTIVINLSGRGDKDLETYMKNYGNPDKKLAFKALKHAN